MAVVCAFYRPGLDVLTPTDWAARADDEVLLIGSSSWVFSSGHTSLIDMSASTFELVASGYARKAVTPGTPAWSAGRWTLPMASIVWSSLGTDEDVYAAVGYDSTDDSPLWAVCDDGGDPLATLDGSDLTLVLALGVT